ncbi:MAG: glycosyltransferase family 2 protein [Deltaproteobacteria bacterium]|nr:glycosyltransferase family 2 protein [Deltaproteobacteria bacterium]
MQLPEPHLTVLMPVYNEEENLRTNIALLINKLDELKCSFEILMVNDGSLDRSLQIIESLMSQESRIRLLQHPFNQGIANSIITGIPEARGTFIIFIPADLALELDELKKYLEMAQHADVIVGIRSDRRDYSVGRKIVSWINIALIKLLFRLPQKQFNHICMYHRRIFKQIHIESQSAFFAAEIMIKARDLGFKISELNVGYLPRKQGKSVACSPKWIRRAFFDLMTFWFKWMKRKYEYSYYKN